MSDAGNHPETEAKPAAPKPAEEQGMHKVDQQVQEQAAEEREKSGGYD